METELTAGALAVRLLAAVGVGAIWLGLCLLAARFCALSSAEPAARPLGRLDLIEEGAREGLADPEDTLALVAYVRRLEDRERELLAEKVAAEMGRAPAGGTA